MEKFARKHGIDLHPAGHGVNWQVLVKEGCAFPMVSDSHSNMYDGISSVGACLSVDGQLTIRAWRCTGQYLPGWLDDGEVVR